MSDPAFFWRVSKSSSILLASKMEQARAMRDNADEQHDPEAPEAQVPARPMLATNLWGKEPPYLIGDYHTGSFFPIPSAKVGQWEYCQAIGFPAPNPHYSTQYPDRACSGLLGKHFGRATNIISQRMDWKGVPMRRLCKFCYEWWSDEKKANRKRIRELMEKGPVSDEEIEDEGDEPINQTGGPGVEVSLQVAIHRIADCEAKIAELTERLNRLEGVQPGFGIFPTTQSSSSTSTKVPPQPQGVPWAPWDRNTWHEDGGYDNVRR